MLYLTLPSDYFLNFLSIFLFVLELTFFDPPHQYTFMILHYETFELYPAPLTPPTGGAKYVDQGSLPNNAFGMLLFLFFVFCFCVLFLFLFVFLFVP